MDNEKERREMYRAYKVEIDKRDLSNSESRDKAILSFSSAGLALSLSFIKFVVPIEKIENFILLYWTWGLFGGAVILTIFSFLFSQYALKKALEDAEEYYLNNKENDTSQYIKYMEKFFAIIPTLLFTSAIVCIVVFSIQNFSNKERNIMNSSDKKETTVPKELEKRGTSIPKKEPLPKTTPDIIIPDKKDD